MIAVELDWVKFEVKLDVWFAALESAAFTSSIGNTIATTSNKSAAISECRLILPPPCQENQIYIRIKTIHSEMKSFL